MLAILVVDDDRNILNLLEFSLQKAGFSVVIARDGKEGLSKAFDHPPDVAVIDVMMPGVHGYEVCRRLRADPRTAHAKIVILTARSQPMDVQAGLDAGADLFLSKPVMPNELVEAVQSLAPKAEKREPETAQPKPDESQEETTTPQAPAEQKEHVAAPVVKPRGHLVCCFSQTPGVGVTTLAVNLSLALALSRQAPTPLIELHSTPGNVLSALGFDSGLPYGDLRATGDVLEWDTLNLHLVDHRSGVRVLPAPPSGSNVPPALTQRAVAILRAQFPLAVADVANELDDRVRSVLLSADLVLMAVTPETPAIRSAFYTIQELTRLEYPTRQILLIVNHVHPQDGVPLDRIKEGLKRPILGVVPHEPSMQTMLEAGRPLLLTQPRSAASQAIGRIAMQLTRGLGLSTASR